MLTIQLSFEQHNKETLGVLSVWLSINTWLSVCLDDFTVWDFILNFIHFSSVILAKFGDKGVSSALYVSSVFGEGGGGKGRSKSWSFQNLEWGGREKGGRQNLGHFKILNLALSEMNCWQEASVSHEHIWLYPQIYIAAFSIVHGDAWRLVYGYDSFGNTCDEDNTNKAIPNISLSGMNMKGRPWVTLHIRDILCLFICWFVR